MISKCNSPIPEIIVSPVSKSPLILKVGSSSPNLLRAKAIFSWSTFVFGSILIEITGSGKKIFSSTIGLFISHKVWPVPVFFKPTTAAMSPAKISETSSRSAAYILKILPILSFSPVFEFNK